jgi:hypothetical protein
MFNFFVAGTLSVTAMDGRKSEIDYHVASVLQPEEAGAYLSTYMEMRRFSRFPRCYVTHRSSPSMYGSRLIGLIMR